MRLIRAVIVAVILTTTPVYAANSPADVEREKAKAYLEENQVEIPEEVEYWCEYYGEQYDICPEVLEAVCWRESRCTQEAQSPDKSCKGLMQIHVGSHRARMERCDVQNIFGIRENIKVGADLLNELQADTDITEALCLYNGDTEGAKRYRETGKASRYAEKVLEVSAALERVHFK
jgi:hypothetical protein